MRHELLEELKRSMDSDSWRRYQSALTKMLGWPAERWNLSGAWLQAMNEKNALGAMRC